MKRIIFSKRTLALILALMMTLSVVYVPAFATGSDDTASDSHVCDFSGEPHVVAPDHVNGKNGYTYFECQVEGCDEVHILSDSIVGPEAGDHVWEDVPAVAPTCTTAGNAAYKVCKSAACDAVADTEGNVVEGGSEAFALPALGHKFTEWTVTTDYQCTDLDMSRECLACGHVESVEWHETYHNYQPVFDDTYVAPKCNAAGQVTFKCVAVHESGIACTAVQENVTIKATRQHITYVVPAVAPTCLETGMQEYHVCTMCGNNFSEANTQGNAGRIGDLTTLVVDATGHNMSEFVRIEGMGCTVEDNMKSVCQNDGCDHVVYATEDHNMSAPVRLLNYACGVENNMISECQHAGCEHTVYTTQGHDHEITSVASTIEDCVETIVTVKTCKFCSNTVTESEAATAHTGITALPAVDPTCKADGLTAGQKCVDCDTVTVPQETISNAELVAAHSALGYHKGVQAATFPTCTTVGYTSGTKCTECGIVVVEPEEIPAAGHQYNTEEIAPTCQTVGYKANSICEVDGCDYVKPGSVLSVVPCVAKEETVLVSEANCMSPEIRKSICKWCDAVVDDHIEVGEIASTKHCGTFSIVKSSAATCFANGWAFATCTECEVVIMVIPNGKTAAEYSAYTLDGTPTDIWMTESEFNTTYPDVLTITVTKREHLKLEEPTTKQDPTCEADGSAQWVCGYDDCTHVIETQVLQAVGHTEDDPVTTTEPTCTNEGVAVIYCTECDKQIRTQSVAATGHSNDGAGEYKVDVEPSCTATGIGRYYCTTEGCGVQIGADVIIEALGHNVEKVFEDIPSCIATGTEYYECTRCGGEQSSTVVPTVAHTHVATGTTATCTEDGITTLVCSVEGCGDTITETTKATGHSFNEETDVHVDPTCTADGYNGWTCVNDGCEYVEKEIIPTTGHSFTGSYLYAETTASCANLKGVYVKKCDNCDTTDYTEEVEYDITKGHGIIEVTDHQLVYTFAHGEDKNVSTENWTYVEHVSNICQTGTVGGYICEICKAEEVIEEAYADQKVGAEIAASHAYEEDVHVMTCTSEGYTNMVCADCQDTYEVEGSRVAINTALAEAHSFVGYWSATTVASCNTPAGVYVKMCEHCETKAFTDEVTYDTTKGHGTLEVVDNQLVYVSAHGEDKNASVDGTWTYVAHVDNKCVEGTVGGYICLICNTEEVLVAEYADKKVGDTIALAHNYQPVVHEMNCVNAGYTEMICSDCSDDYVVDGSFVEIDSESESSHDLSAGYTSVVTQANCGNVSGVYAKKCADCGKTYTYTVEYDTTKGHGYIAIEDGELVYVAAYTDKNVSTDNWTYVEHVSNICQTGTVGGYVCNICSYTEYIDSTYEGEKIGSDIKASHNMRADAQAPSCESLGIEGWTYHEYCTDCDLGHTPDGTWEVLSCVPCTVVTVKPVAPTCHEAGTAGYTYKACCSTTVEIAEAAAAALIPATNHEGTVVTLQTAPATCTTPSFKYSVCTACNGADTFALEEYIAPLGHNVVENGTGVDATCTTDGKYSDKICDRCGDESTLVEGEVILATGHFNAAGDKFLDTDKCAADVLDNDRHCVVCDKDIDFVHRFDEQITNATCQTSEIHINTCVDCNTQLAMEVVRGPWTEEEHKAAIMGNLVDSVDATPTTYGVDTYKCPHCDETIVVNTPLAGGIEFELDYSVVYPTFDEDGKFTGFTKSDRKETANGTWIAVDVLVYGNKDFHFSQLDVSFSFNNNVVYFGSDMTTGIDNLVIESVVSNEGVVSISAGVPQNSDVAYTFVNTVGEDAEGAVLATVYFMVKDDANVGAASFTFGTKQNVWLVEDADIVDITKFASFDAEALTFTSKVLGDYIKDGAVNGAELLAIKQMINGKLDETYDVVLDLDKDGSITVVDYEILKSLVNVDDVFNSALYEAIAGN